MDYWTVGWIVIGIAVGTGVVTPGVGSGLVAAWLSIQVARFLSRRIG